MTQARRIPKFIRFRLRASISLTQALATRSGSAVRKSEQLSRSRIEESIRTLFKSFPFDRFGLKCSDPCMRWHLLITALGLCICLLGSASRAKIFCRRQESFAKIPL